MDTQALQMLVDKPKKLQVVFDKKKGTYTVVVYDKNSVNVRFKR
jgi:hypothetical protein